MYLVVDGRPSWFNKSWLLKAQPNRFLFAPWLSTSVLEAATEINMEIEND